jgi:hypothetical protein
MSQIKTSPNTDNMLAGGDHLFVTLPGDAAPTHFGHIEPIAITPDKEVKETINAIDGTPAVVKRRINLKKVEYKFKALERTAALLKSWFLGGSAGSASQQASTSETETVETIVGTDDETEVMTGGWYPLAKRGVSTVVVTSGGENPTVLVEGTDYKLDYHAGRIAFLRALTEDELAYDVTYHCEAQTQSYFSKWSETEISVSAEIWRVFEDGAVVEKETIPLARLEPDGNAQDVADDNTPLEFNLVALKHPTLGWGTVTRVDRG